MLKGDVNMDVLRWLKTVYIQEYVEGISFSNYAEYMMMVSSKMNVKGRFVNKNSKLPYGAEKKTMKGNKKRLKNLMSGREIMNFSYTYDTAKCTPLTHVYDEYDENNIDRNPLLNSGRFEIEFKQIMGVDCGRNQNA